MPLVPSTTPQPRARRTQAERSAATRARLLDASIGCLIDYGYAGTTTLAVCKRAGVSNGSLLHHYGTRERLLGATLEAVYGRLRGEVVRRLEALPKGDDRIDALVDVLWSAFGAPEFKAILELWLAAASHADLSWSMWPEAQAFDEGNVPLAEALFPEVAARLPDFSTWISLIFQVVQGLGLVNATRPSNVETDALRARTLTLFKAVLRDAFKAEAAPC
ncbi:MAG: TetR/AcrR family transcriptional regulator [Deltaproteobacteria bacterium]|nr:TetR/AcrR family transcriptional regulator [Deltaproteobacteria bacterium]MBW2396016.1 TetR/AcrR family transcriptional regulator [Deltaproteobacteria bacterium]